LFYIVDNFLPKDYFKEIQDLVVHNEYFPWFLNKGKVTKEDGDYQFTHTLVSYKKINSQLYDNFVPLFEKINPKEIQRAKFNLTPKTSNQEASPPHVDYHDGDIKACVFYLNTNNGFTYFGEEKVFSVENRIVFFNGNHEHGGATCTDSNVRVVLNINYF
tara:strand:- start:1904 stop:2383 length:480 start_codon:yes stop_codon:yes gene_type:complete